MGKQNKKKPPLADRKKLLWLGALLCCLTVLAVVLLVRGDNGSAQQDTTLPQPAPAVLISDEPQNMRAPLRAAACKTARIENFSDLDSDLPGAFPDCEGLELVRVGVYTGTFTELGTDEWKQEVLSLVVCNTGEKMMERAVLTVQTDVREAEFIVTYLPAGACCLVQEHQALVPGSAIQMTGKAVREISYVNQEDVTVHPQTLEIRAQDGTLCISNISGADIPGSVNVWYKTVRDGLYLGGISYKASVDHGVLRKDAQASIKCAHYTQSGSEILLASFGE